MSRQSLKFPFISPEVLYYESNIGFQNLTGFAVINRATVITKHLLTLFLEIFNGIKFYTILISNDTLSHLFGEFSPTRKKPISRAKEQKTKKKKK